MNTLLLALAAASAAAHDIPADAAVDILVKPEAQQLHVMVRAPLRSIRDVVFPELPGGYLDVQALAPLLADAAKVSLADSIQIEENGRLVPAPRIAAVRISLPDRSFTAYDQALAHLHSAPLSNSEKVIWNQVFLDAQLEYPISSEQSSFAIRPRLDHLASRVVVSLLFLPPGGTARAYLLQGDQGMLPLDPRWTQSAGRFLELGFWHILGGADHLLFLLCLVIPFRKFTALVGIVTSFTVAHSITLLGSAYGLVGWALWFPSLIETLIAASIVWMALENIVGATSARRRWTMAFAFGLVHGFGFSFALKENLQFAGAHLLVSLLSFNVGVELGQLVMLSVFLGVLAAVFRWLIAERMGVVILSAFVAHTGWHWFLDRAEILAKYRIEPPAIDASFLAWIVRAVMLVMVLWAVRRWVHHREA